MNSTRKLLIKIELCRSLLDSLSSEKLKSTLLWMADDFTRVFNEVEKLNETGYINEDKQKASVFLAKNKEAIKAAIPDDLTALFMVSAITYIFGGLIERRSIK